MMAIFEYPDCALTILQRRAALRKALADCKTVLDVGCGKVSQLAFLVPQKRLWAVDLNYDAFIAARESGVYQCVFQSNALNIDKLFKSKSFDAVVALEVIEHLTREDGIRLQNAMAWVARKKIALSTPNGFLEQSEFDNNALQAHRSGWTCADFEGYKIQGLYGPKKMRGKFYGLRARSIFQVFLSALQQGLHTRTHPEYATSLFCVKEV